MPRRFTCSFGQSNGGGADNLGHMWLDGRFNYTGVSPLLTAWNNDAFSDYSDTDTSSGLGSAIVAVTKNSAPFVTNAGTGTLRTAGNNNPGAHFANYLTVALGDYVTHFNFCRGSTTIDKWIETDGTRQPLYTKALAIIALAKTALSISSLVFSAVTIHFGEGDNGSGQIEYFQTRLLALRTAMIADGIADTSTVFLLTQPRAAYSASIAALTATAAANSAFMVVDCSDLTDRTGDADHYDGLQLMTIGYRCFLVLCSHATRPTSLGLPRVPVWKKVMVPVGAVGSNTIDSIVYARAMAMTQYCLARGFWDQSGTGFAYDTWTDVPLAPGQGDMEMVATNGTVLIPRGGLWRITVRSYLGNAHGVSSRIYSAAQGAINVGGDNPQDSNEDPQRKTHVLVCYFSRNEALTLQLKHMRSATTISSITGPVAYKEISVLLEWMGV